MSLSTTQTPLPVQYRTEASITCDACGKQSTSLIGAGIASRSGLKFEFHGPFVPGWFQGEVPTLDQKTNVVDIDSTRRDYCDDCWPKLSQVLDNEAKKLAKKAKAP